MKEATILITRPIRKGDPTEYTYKWGEEAIKIAKSLGYDIVDIRGNDATYENVSEAITKYQPRFYAHFGHGCPLSLQGQYECIVARKYDIDQLISMAESPDPIEREKFLRLLNPLGQISCPGICTLNDDPCSPVCIHDTNINLLKGSIVYGVACHSASQLGKHAIKYGVESYIGYDDLLMFPVDSLNSQDMFGEIQLTMFKELLLGKTIQEAEMIMEELEDSYIRRFKEVKYIALPMLWNKLHRKIVGNANNLIYNQ